MNTMDIENCISNEVKKVKVKVKSRERRVARSVQDKFYVFTYLTMVLFFWANKTIAIPFASWLRLLCFGLFQVVLDERKTWFDSLYQQKNKRIHE